MIVLYTTEDGRSVIRLRTKDETVWLSQREMAQLFDVSTDNVGLHLKNLYEDGELSREATAEESSVVQIAGGNEGVGFRTGDRSGFQPSDPSTLRLPGALPQAGIALDLWPCKTDKRPGKCPRLPRQRRISIPARGSAPGNAPVSRANE